MGDATMADPPPPPLPPQQSSSLNDYDCLPIPPMDHAFFSQQHLTLPDHTTSFAHQNDDDDEFFLDDIDFDFSFDDLDLPPFNDSLDSSSQSQLPNSNSCQPTNNLPLEAFEATSEELPYTKSPECSNHSRVLNFSSSLTPENCQNSGDILSYLNESPENFLNSGGRSADGAGHMNVPSPESNGSNKGLNEVEVLNFPSPAESQGSGNCGSNVSEADSKRSANSVYSSPNFDVNSIRNGVVDQKIRLEGYVKNENNSNCIYNSGSNKNSLLKRKKDTEDSNNNNNNNVEMRTSKYQKSGCNSGNSGDENGNFTTEEEKRKARLLRNRESAQLSRQRKKHYVVELEDKVRTMHSTIQDLNAKISYVMAENATLRQQLGSGTVQPMMAPPPGMYPPPPMMYPWMPPPYLMKQHGSQVPLVPIPRLKPQQPVAAPKTSKKAKSKKTLGKTKKVASVSFLGLLFFILLFGWLVPVVNVRYGGMREAVMGGSDVRNELYELHHGRILTVNGSGYGENFDNLPGFSSNVNCVQRGHVGGEPYYGDEFVRAGNGSEPLMASLYVPRNDHLVKIDGNLIIHSVLASEKALASREDSDSKERMSDETGLAVPVDLSPGVPIPGIGRNDGRHPHLPLGSGAANDNMKSNAAAGRLHQWFREGLAGPMLSSGMCTEVLRFEMSPASVPGAIVPATSAKNISLDSSQNSTHVSNGKNRRILRGLPIPLPGSSAHNISEEQEDSRKRNAPNSASSMVVSVLMDPREAADTEGDGVMGRKSLSRIFVVVLIDSVKYVTYSCMLPFKGAVPHLVTT